MIGGVAVIASMIRIHALWAYFNSDDPAYDAIGVSTQMEHQYKPQHIVVMARYRYCFGGRSRSTLPLYAPQLHPFGHSSNPHLQIQSLDPKPVVLSTAATPTTASAQCRTEWSFRRQKEESTIGSRRRYGIWIVTARS